MAFDSKRLRTFEWLEDIAQCNNAYRRSFPRFPHILAYCDSLYATDEIVLAKVDYPEFAHLSDYVWSEIVDCTDEKGMLLEMPIIQERERQFTDRRFFDKFFEDTSITAFEKVIDPRVLKTGLKVFEINKINPNMYTAYDRVFMMGHNHDVSIKVCMMGVGTK